MCYPCMDSQRLSAEYEQSIGGVWRFMVRMLASSEPPRRCPVMTTSAGVPIAEHRTG